MVTKTKLLNSSQAPADALCQKWQLRTAPSPSHHLRGPKEVCERGISSTCPPTYLPTDIAYITLHTYTYKNVVACIRLYKQFVVDLDCQRPSFTGLSQSGIWNSRGLGQIPSQSRGLSYEVPTKRSFKVDWFQQQRTSTLIASPS